MTSKSRAVRIVGLFSLAAVASSMARFFDDPNPVVALVALTAWACCLVAIVKTRRP